MAQSTKYFSYIVIALVTVFLTNNILSAKATEVFGLTFGVVAVFFPISLIIGDISAEVYGYRKTRTAVLIGLACYLYFTLLSLITVALPPAPEWPNQEHYAQVFNIAPRIFIGGCLAYLAAEFINAYIMTKMKVMQKGKYFWLRAMVSTFFGELIHSVIRAPFAFWGVLPNEKIIELIITATIIKIVVEALLLPFTTIIVKKLKAAEGVE